MNCGVEGGTNCPRDDKNREYQDIRFQLDGAKEVKETGELMLKIHPFGVLKSPKKIHMFEGEMNAW